MAAEITIFATGIYDNIQVPRQPLSSHATNFTAASGGVMRVYANAGAVVLTINGITFTVPSGTVEYFGITTGQAVTVA